jgi:uncharacterized protein YdcH (DUF465 family)
MQDKSRSPNVDQLVAKHRKLDEEVGQLENQRILSKTESFKLKSLKILKLRLKDAICLIQERECG